MKVLRAETIGFCMGVRRAVEIVEGLIENPESLKPIYTLGPLIHNRVFLENLEQKGVKVANSEDEIDAGTVVIRAHGVGPDIIEKLKEKQVDIVDATCPRVLRSQKIAMDYSAKGFKVLLIGDKNHGEVIGIQGYAEDCEIISSKEEAERIKDIQDKTIIIGQTTLKIKEYESICSILVSKNSNIEVANTICPATQQRQGGLIELCSKVDAVVVVGGKSSANTTRLYKTALQMEKPSWHVESEEELSPELKDYEIIGLTAGASTPDWIIDAVEKKILEM